VSLATVDGRIELEYVLPDADRDTPHSRYLESEERSPSGNRPVAGDTDDYELYEEDGEFVLSIELPGFEREEISVMWDDGVLNIAAEHDDEARNERRTYHRRFRFPKEVIDEDIAASYQNGVLEVTLPIEGPATSGREIDVE
jgi:HSP20 family protein